MFENSKIWEEKCIKLINKFVGKYLFPWPYINLNDKATPN